MSEPGRSAALRIVYFGVPATGSDRVLPVLGDDVILGGDPFAADAVDALRDLWGVRVLLPVRRQDRYMEHAHLDAVRRGSAVPFAEQFPRPKEPTLDWAVVAERLSAVPGVEQVDVLPLDTDDDAVAHALGVALLEPPPTFSARGIRVARALNEHLADDAERALVRQFVAATFPGRTGPDQFLSAATRARVVGAYAEANRRLFRDWLPGYPENAWDDDALETP